MDLMTLLYRIMEELSLAGVPIVYKGAMVLNLAIHENNPSGITRATRDIDGDWYGAQPTMEQIEKHLKEAIHKVEPELTIHAVREFGEKKAAGFRIDNVLGEKVASIDLSIRNNPYAQTYISYVNGIQIAGASLEKMMADKLFAVSEDKVLRRLKDLLDIYIMSFIGTFETAGLQEIWKNTGRVPGDFSFIAENMKVIGEGYNRMIGIENKPDFSELYHRLLEFVQPMTRRPMPEVKWQFSVWEGLRINQTKDKSR